MSSTIRRLKALQASLLAEWEWCGTCKAPVGVTRIEEIHVCDIDPQECPECKRPLDDNGKPIMASRILILGEIAQGSDAWIDEAFGV